LKASKDGLLGPRGSLANEVPFHAMEQANQYQLPFTNEMISTYTGNGGNHEYNCLSKTTLHKHV